MSRGFFRLWVFASVTWLILIAALLGPDTLKEWRMGLFDEIPEGAVPEVPVRCELARGQIGAVSGEADFYGKDGDVGIAFLSSEVCSQSMRTSLTNGWSLHFMKRLT